jgi:two-component system, OmpR family, response regulator AdeR
VNASPGAEGCGATRRHAAYIVGVALVLVVEDERELAEVLEGYLRQAGHRTERASDGPTAVAIARRARPDLVLLDVHLPGMDGHDVLRAIRAQGPTPVIFLTARSDEVDRIVGLELGADDYVTKPFSPREVMARVKAVLRRGAAAASPDGAEPPLRLGPLEVDRTHLRASVDGQELALTVAECRILWHLAAHPGRVFPRVDLLEAALPDSDALERVVDAHMKNLRRKLDAAGAAVRIETVRGAGYRLRVP